MLRSARSIRLAPSGALARPTLFHDARLELWGVWTSDKMMAIMCLSVEDAVIFSLVAPLLPSEALCALACTSHVLHDAVHAAEHVWAGLATGWRGSIAPVMAPFAGLSWRATVRSLWRERRAISLYTTLADAEIERDCRTGAIGALQNGVLDLGREIRTFEARAAVVHARLSASSSMRERATQWHLTAMRRSPAAFVAPSRAETLRLATEHAELSDRIAKARSAREGAKAQLRAATIEFDGVRRRCAALGAALDALCGALARETSGAFFGRLVAALACEGSPTAIEFAVGNTAAARAARRSKAVSFFGAHCAAWNSAHAHDGLAVPWPDDLVEEHHSSHVTSSAALCLQSRC